jgi:hypothetical protein
VSKPLLLCVFVLTALVTYAAGIGLKPGLWEIKVVKQVMDGRDMTAQTAGVSAQMQQAMANMTPEQRARIQAMMPKAGLGLGDNGAVRICVSPEMAKRDRPVIDKEGHCQPASVKHDGNVTTFEFSCTSNGTTRQGKGEATSAGDLITTRVDMTSQAAGGQTHTMHNESEMHYIGVDCGDVKPIEAPK